MSPEGYPPPAALLPNSQWFIWEEILVAWFSDTEFFDISAAPEAGYELRLNDAAEGSTIYLGDSDTISQAQERARAYLGGS
jgi:hypothetical protein